MGGIEFTTGSSAYTSHACSLVFPVRLISTLSLSLAKKMTCIGFRRSVTGAGETKTNAPALCLSIGGVGRAEDAAVSVTMSIVTGCHGYSLQALLSRPAYPYHVQKSCTHAGRYSRGEACHSVIQSTGWRAAFDTEQYT